MLSASLGALFVAAFARADAPATVDVVVLKDGTEVTGKVVGQVPDQSVVLRRPDGTEVEYSWRDVRRIDHETAPREATGGGQHLKVGLDAFVAFPLGDFADQAGPMLGATLRGGVMVSPGFEVGAGAGYAVGTTKKTISSDFDVQRSVSFVPVWIDGRYYVSRTPEGFYGTLEVGLEMLMGKVSVTDRTGFHFEQSDSEMRLGVNAGLGYVVSRSLPVDFRARFMVFNVAGRNSGEPIATALSLGVGYAQVF